MQPSDIPRALAAATTVASTLGLSVEDTVMLQDSNRITVHMLPCDVLARIAYVGHQAGARFEIEVARRLAPTDSPVEMPDPRAEPRVYEQDGFAVTLWTYYAPVPPREIAPAEYAQALGRLHRGMRPITLAAPHFTDRVAEAQSIIDNPDLSPELGDAERQVLSTTLRTLRQAITQRTSAEQLLHGEPHPGNVLRSKDGLLFVDLETCCYGPVEFDIVHAPPEISVHYPDADQTLLRLCRVLMLAMIIAWRWDRHDQLPDGRRLAAEWLSQMRVELERDDWPLRDGGTTPVAE